MFSNSKSVQYKLQIFVSKTNTVFAQATETKEETSPDPLADEVAKAKAKAALIAHVPDWLSTMVGQQSSKMGISKVFDTIQEKTLNKLLVYDLLEVIIYSLFPELVRSYAFQQFRNVSMQDLANKTMIFIIFLKNLVRIKSEYTPNMYPVLKKACYF